MCAILRELRGSSVHSKKCQSAFTLVVTSEKRYCRLMNFSKRIICHRAKEVGGGKRVITGVTAAPASLTNAAPADNCKWTSAEQIRVHQGWILTIHLRRLSPCSATGYQQTHNCRGSVGGLWITSFLRQKSGSTLFLQKGYPCRAHDHTAQGRERERKPPSPRATEKPHFVQEQVELLKLVSSACLLLKV